MAECETFDPANPECQRCTIGIEMARLAGSPAETSEEEEEKDELEEEFEEEEEEAEEEEGKESEGGSKVELAFVPMGPTVVVQAVYEKAKPIRMNGMMIIMENEFQRILKKMHLEVVSTDPTPYDGVVMAHIEKKRRALKKKSEEPKKKGKVVNKQYNGGLDPTKIVEKLLCPVVGNVSIDTPHNRIVAPRPSPSGVDFEVHVWSSPVDGERTNCPGTVWGIRVDCSDSIFPYSYNGIPIICDDAVLPGCSSSPFVMGEIVKNHLYIYWDAIHHGSNNEARVFERFLQEAIKTLEKGEAAREEYLTNLRSSSSEAFIKVARSRLDRNIKETMRNIEATKKEVDNLQTHIVTKIREFRGLNRKVEQLQASMSGENTRYEKEFLKILEVANVQHVFVQEGSLSILTDVLKATDPRTKKVHELGAFMIRVNIDPNRESRGIVRIHNTTRQVNTGSGVMQAPHVFHDGNPCYGSISEAIPQLIGSEEYAALVDVIIVFLQSVNVDDAAGKYIDRWPVVEEAPKEEPKSEAVPETTPETAPVEVSP